MTNLSEHCTVEEFEYSDTARAKKLNNKMDEAHRKVAEHTCKYLLEPLRNLLNTHYGCKVIMKITSGYRGPQLNKAVGGASTSQHCKAEATDIDCFKVTETSKIRIAPSEIYGLIKKWVKEGKISVDQCIDERAGSTTWTHVSHSAWGKARDRKQFLLYRGGKYVLDK